jgi:hypothetical protein
MTIDVADRPYIITFRASGHSYPLSAEEARRLLDNYPVVSASRNRLVFPGHNTSRPSERSEVRPATRGGGPAFTIHK